MLNAKLRQGIGTNRDPQGQLIRNSSSRSHVDLSYIQSLLSDYKNLISKGPSLIAFYASDAIIPEEFSNPASEDYHDARARV
jgi:hypothetical protein